MLLSRQVNNGLCPGFLPCPLKQRKPGQSDLITLDGRQAPVTFCTNKIVKWNLLRALERGKGQGAGKDLEETVWERVCMMEVIMYTCESLVVKSIILYNHHTLGRRDGSVVNTGCSPKEPEFNSILGILIPSHGLWGHQPYVCYT